MKIEYLEFGILFKLYNLGQEELYKNIPIFTGIIPQKYFKQIIDGYYNFDTHLLFNFRHGIYDEYLFIISKYKYYIISPGKELFEISGDNLEYLIFKLEEGIKFKINNSGNIFEFISEYFPIIKLNIPDNILLEIKNRYNRFGYGNIINGKNLIIIKYPNIIIETPEYTIFISEEDINKFLIL